MFIDESGMHFGDYPESHIFYIEKSEEYEKIKEKGVKIVEFVLLKEDKLLLLEAKTTAPNPQSEETPERFGEYIAEIAEKMRNSLDLYLHQLARRELTDTLLDADYHSISIVCVLVIKKHEKEWLAPVQEALSKELQKHIRINTIWKCQMIVINEEQAVSLNLVHRT